MGDESKRRKRIDDAVDSADNARRKKKPAPKAKNPYPVGSARAKLWDRREADRRKDNQSTDSNQ